MLGPEALRAEEEEEAWLPFLVAVEMAEVPGRLRVKPELFGVVLLEWRGACWERREGP